MKLKYILTLLIGFGIWNVTEAQTYEKFKKLSSPEKCWVIFHPFKAKRAKRVTDEVIATIDSISKADKIVHKTGNQLDAFKHAFWMYSLAEEIGWRSAKSFGIQHEKGNYEFYQQHKLEDGELPDKVSGDMDLHNNAMGLELYKTHKKEHLSKKEIIKVVRRAVVEGKMKIIAQSSTGKYLDEKGNIIPKKAYYNLWKNPKVLITSKSTYLLGDNKSKSLNLSENFNR